MTENYQRYARIAFTIKETSKADLTPEKANKMIRFLRDKLMDWRYAEYQPKEDLLSGQLKEEQVVGGIIEDIDQFQYWVIEPKKTIGCVWHSVKFNIWDKTATRDANFNHFLPARMSEDIKKLSFSSRDIVLTITDVGFK